MNGYITMIIASSCIDFKPTTTMYQRATQTKHNKQLIQLFIFIDHLLHGCQEKKLTETDN